MLDFIKIFDYTFWIGILVFTFILGYVIFTTEQKQIVLYRTKIKAMIKISIEYFIKKK